MRLTLLPKARSDFRIGCWLLVLFALVPPSAVLATPVCGGEPGWASREFGGNVKSPDAYFHEVDAQALSQSFSEVERALFVDTIIQRGPQTA